MNEVFLVMSNSTSAPARYRGGGGGGGVKKDYVCGT